MSNKIEEEFREEILLADALLRLSVIEKLLINKGIFTKEEFLEETSKISSQITQILLEKINAPTDLNKIAEKIKSNKEN
jgi:hypothetical protein